jgi:hypothetical protein
MSSDPAEIPDWRRDEAVDLAEQLLDEVNGGVNTAAFVSHVGNGHRHLQSELFDQLVEPLIREFARKAETGDYDGRTERVVQTCERLVETLDDDR